MDQKEQIDKVAHVLKNWRNYSSPESTRGRSHSGLKHIKGHEEVAAQNIIRSPSVDFVHLKILGNKEFWYDGKLN